MLDVESRIGNDCLYKAATCLIEGQGNAKERVINACRLLNRMSANEVRLDLRLRIDKVLIQAGSEPGLQNAVGEVIRGRDKFFQTAINKRNSTYAKLAKQIYDIYWDELHSK